MSALGQAVGLVLAVAIASVATVFVVAGMADQAWYVRLVACFILVGIWDWCADLISVAVKGRAS